jgi:hypothetical protein
MSPAMQIEQKGMDFLGPKIKAAMGAFTDGWVNSRYSRRS